jgi:hypothetical protein
MTALRILKTNGAARKALKGRVFAQFTRLP